MRFKILHQYVELEPVMGTERIVSVNNKLMRHYVHIAKQVPIQHFHTKILNPVI